MPIHDLQHRLNPQFPEVSSGTIWAQREYLYSRITKHASKILVDSKIGKEDVVNIYRVDPSKILILPFLPPNYLEKNTDEKIKQDFVQKHRLLKDFLFYPAQLWPHKNHLNIIKALGILKRQGLIVNLVLTGSKKGKWNTHDAIMHEAEKQEVINQLQYFGYVDNREISILYQLAKALLMPTSIS